MRGIVTAKDAAGHHFQMLDGRHQQLLTDQRSIHVLELNKWQKSATLKQQDHWLYFFKEALIEQLRAAGIEPKL